MNKSKNFKYYQPNEMDLKDNYGDCAIRCLCKAEKKTWLEMYDLMWKLSREIQSPMNNKYGFEHIVKSLGYQYYGISNKKGSKRPTIDEFASQHKEGTYICVVANHYVAVEDGLFYDTWDSGRKSMYGYWKKGE
jgi:hypothetical protein